MRRFLTLFSALALAGALGFTACADDADEAGETTEEIGENDDATLYDEDVTVEGDVDVEDDWTDDVEEGAEEVGEEIEEGANEVSDVVDDRTEESN